MYVDIMMIGEPGSPLSAQLGAMRQAYRGARDGGLSGEKLARWAEDKFGPEWAALGIAVYDNNGTFAVMTKGAAASLAALDPPGQAPVLPVGHGRPYGYNTGVVGQAVLVRYAT